MKLLLTFLLGMTLVTGFAQPRKFDVVAFNQPGGWVMQTEKSAVKLSAENKAKGDYCFITIFKSVPGSGDSKKNFDAAWETIVKKVVMITDTPQMQEPATDNGWEAQTGFAGYEDNGQKGVAMLVSSTANNTMVNILVLTNTNIYEKQLNGFFESVVLAKPAGKTTTKDPRGGGSATNNQPGQNIPAPGANYKFTSTNWDDGWVSNVKSDWVEVNKAGIKVIIHYPNPQADEYNSSKQQGDMNAWNILVAPRYSNITNFYDRGIQDYESVTFLTADAVDKQSGRKVHIILFKKHYDKGNGRYMEVVADTRTRFEQEFGSNYINRSSWEYMEQIKSWDKLANMQWKNKFAVTSGDLTGKWRSSTYASLAYYYVNGGGFAGATATSIADEFTFLTGGNYQSDHAGASGAVGNQKFSRTVYKGKAAVTNWSITLTNRFQGQTEKFDCYFEAIKGGRILVMTDRLGYTTSLVKSN